MLLIGCGGYIQQTLLPALKVLAHQFEITGLINRSGQTPAPVQAMFPDLRADTSLDAIDFRQTDIVFVCIPENAVPKLMVKLHRYDTAHLTIMVSTPVLGLRQSHLSPLFKPFKQVLAFENAFCLPPFLLAKQLIDQGKIGQPKKLNLFHSGFRYHGLALVRFLLDGAYPLYSRALSFGQYSEYHFKFRRGCYATMVEPRDYAVGSFMLAGNQGIICDYALKAKNSFEIGYQQNADGVYCALMLNGVQQPTNALDQLFTDKLPIDALPDPSLFRQLHIRAAVEIFHALEQNNTTYLYHHSQTLYDNLLIHLTRRLGVCIDPAALFGRSLLKFLYLRLWPLLRGGRKR